MSPIPLTAFKRSPDVAVELAERVVEAAREALDLEISVDQAVIREGAREHGADYQCNAAMGLAKRLGRPSREVAGELVERLRVGDLCETPQIAGPGFINLRLRTDWLGARLAETLADPRLGIPTSEERVRVVVDYSAPNVAKEMHVGHLRSTIIGDALVRMLRFLGHEALPQNHVGDWGTPFGMLIEHMLDEDSRRDGGGDGAGAGDADRPASHSIGDLNVFYREARVKFDGDAGFAERARERVVALQGGDPGTLELWRELVRESERHFEEVYGLLGVLLTGDHVAGESVYNEQLADVVDTLSGQGLAVESDGALCVFPDGFTGRDGEPTPLIVRKRDGGYTYDTTDLAALRHRILDLGARELLYVVGAPQRLHFELVFAVGREAGWLGTDTDARHVAFGSVLGEDGKMLRTRSGEPVRLVDLLREAVERAAGVLAERGAPEGSDGARLAEAIGIGAVKYADLCGDREKDYVFSFDRMLSLEGNTSVYLQYANARARSVLRRAAAEDPGWAGGENPRGAPAERPTGASGGGAEKKPVAIDPREPAEHELALALIRLPAALDAVLEDFKPHRLCTYLHSLAVGFSGFYEACPVLGAQDPAVRASRLELCRLTSETITLALGLLGIEAPERLSPPPLQRT